MKKFSYSEKGSLSFYSGFQLIRWNSSTLMRAIFTQSTSVGANLTQKHPYRNTLNIIFPNIWALVVTSSWYTKETIMAYLFGSRHSENRIRHEWKEKYTLYPYSFSNIMKVRYRKKSTSFRKTSWTTKDRIRFLSLGLTYYLNKTIFLKIRCKILPFNSQSFGNRLWDWILVYETEY